MPDEALLAYYSLVNIIMFDYLVINKYVIGLLG